jgi:hypothetical protein
MDINWNRRFSMFTCSSIIQGGSNLTGTIFV